MVAIFKENIDPIYNDVAAVVVVVAYGGFLLVSHRCHNCGTVAPLLILFNICVNFCVNNCVIICINICINICVGGGFLLMPHRCHNCGTVAPLLILYNKGATLCGTFY